MGTEGVKNKKEHDLSVVTQGHETHGLGDLGEGGKFLTANGVYREWFLEVLKGNPVLNCPAKVLEIPLCTRVHQGRAGEGQTIP